MSLKPWLRGTHSYILRLYILIILPDQTYKIKIDNKTHLFSFQSESWHNFLNFSITDAEVYAKDFGDGTWGQMQ